MPHPGKFHSFAIDECYEGWQRQRARSFQVLGFPGTAPYGVTLIVSDVLNAPAESHAFTVR